MQTVSCGMTPAIAVSVVTIGVMLATELGARGKERGVWVAKPLLSPYVRPGGLLSSIDNRLTTKSCWLGVAI
jgi:hypothetical protein